MDTSNFGFDPTQFTDCAPAGPPKGGFTLPIRPIEVLRAARDTTKALTEWVPLLKKVTVSQPQAGVSGESAAGATRTLVFQGGLTLVEHVVYWNPPLCYAYDTRRARVFPLR